MTNNDFIFRHGELTLSFKYHQYTNDRKLLVTPITKDVLRGIMLGAAKNLKFHESEHFVFEVFNGTHSLGSLVVHLNNFKQGMFVSLSKTSCTIDLCFTDSTYDRLTREMNSILNGVIHVEN